MHLNDIINAYTAGMPVAEICKKFQLHTPDLYTILKAAKTPYRGHSARTEKKVPAVIKRQPKLTTREYAQLRTENQRLRDMVVDFMLKAA